MRNRLAFTLIELLVVIALIMMTIGLTLQQFSSCSRSVRTELELLYQTSLYMQRRALVMRQKQVLHLDIEHNAYSFEDRTHRLPSGVQFGIMSVKGPPASPSRPLEKSSTFKNNQIIFYPDGPIEPGSVYLTNDKKNQLYALTVAVAPYSYLRTYCYADTWRLLQ
jgi:type II secretory pathway pseudopilin PulG